jgi:hypothetical protein
MNEQAQITIHSTWYRQSVIALRKYPLTYAECLKESKRMGEGEERTAGSDPKIRYSSDLKHFS